MEPELMDGIPFSLQPSLAKPTKTRLGLWLEFKRERFQRACMNFRNLMRCKGSRAETMYCSLCDRWH